MTDWIEMESHISCDDVCDTIVRLRLAVRYDLTAKTGERIAELRWWSAVGAGFICFDLIKRNR